MTTNVDSLIFDPAAHRYFLGDMPLPNVTRVLEAAGLIDYSFLGDRREVYLERGHAVHRATADDDEGLLAEDSVAPEIRGYLEAWRAFKRDYAFVPRLVEHRVYNEECGYAGTLDRVGRIRDGTEIILDIKSGAAPAAAAVQLAAYAACLEHPRTRLRRCVEVHRDSSYRVIPYATSDYLRDFAEFVVALEIFRTREEKS